MKRITGLLLVVLAVAGVLCADSALSITGAGDRQRAVDHRGRRDISLPHVFQVV